MAVLRLDQPSPRQKLGAILYQNYKDDARYKEINFEDLASQIGMTTKDLAKEIDILKIAGFVDHAPPSIKFDRGRRTDGGPFPWEAYNKIALTNNGILWADSGFGPLQMPGVTNISVSVDVHIAIKQAIQSINKTDDTTPEQRERVAELLRHLEDELDRPTGKGKFSTVKDLLETAAASKSLLGPVIGFLSQHWPEVDQLTDLV